MTLLLVLLFSSQVELGENCIFIFKRIHKITHRFKIKKKDRIKWLLQAFIMMQVEDPQIKYLKYMKMITIKVWTLVSKFDYYFHDISIESQEFHFIFYCNSSPKLQEKRCKSSIINFVKYYEGQKVVHVLHSMVFNEQFYHLMKQSSICQISLTLKKTCCHVVLGQIFDSLYLVHAISRHSHFSDRFPRLVLNALKKQNKALTQACLFKLSILLLKKSCKLYTSRLNFLQKLTTFILYYVYCSKIKLSLFQATQSKLKLTIIQLVYIRYIQKKMSEINQKFSTFTQALQQALKVFKKAGLDATTTQITFKRVVRMGNGNMQWNQTIPYVGIQFTFQKHNNSEQIFNQFRYDWDTKPTNPTQAEKKPFWGPHINFIVNKQPYGYYWQDPKGLDRWELLPAQCKKLNFTLTKDNNPDPDKYEGKKFKLSQLLNLDPTITDKNYEGNWEYAQNKK